MRLTLDRKSGRALTHVDMKIDFRFSSTSGVKGDEEQDPLFKTNLRGRRG